MSPRSRLAYVVALAATTVLVAPTTPVHAAEPETSPTDITLTQWDSGDDFAKGRSSHLRPGQSGTLRIGRDAGTTTYTDPFGDGTAKTYEYGTWTSPVVRTGYAIDESVTSWDVDTPTGTWAEVRFRGQKADGTWTKWFVMGRWTAGDDFAAGDIHRTSVEGQNDTDAALYTDTYVARTGKEPEAFQTSVTLLRPEGATVSPSLRSVSTLTNEYLPASAYPGTSTPTLGKEIDLGLPPFSQNIHRGEYPEFGGGGQVWCSPTSTTMVQYHWGREVPASELEGIVAPNGDPQVDYAAINTWDYAYEGAGNWPFNIAYATRWGLDGFVTRLRSLAEAERLVKAGIPLVVSANWDLEEMPEAGYGTNGHLLVIGGFTVEGDPIVYDPNYPSNDEVRNVYTRENFERVWQTSTDGIAYVIHPDGMELPGAGKATNW
ncbi:C39 family peptidase [Nocardioides sp. NPDC006273]|uniref:C39 family peptidase n=1 Tax=Nocardioides sp. NPDC006273 TaxID=3155598 RepID=UPI0033B23877